MSTITINVQIATLTTKIKQHLAVVGKRAKDPEGRLAYSDLTTSTAEDERVWVDFILGGAETVVAALRPLSGSYQYNSADNELTFKVMSERWLQSGDNIHDLTEALHDAIERYLWHFAASQYVMVITPPMKDRYGHEIQNPHVKISEAELLKIMELAYLKRPATPSNKEYENVTGEVTT